MIRFFDIFFSLIGISLAFPILLVILIVSMFDTGSPIFRQKRVGRNKTTFILIKFRTMPKGTKSLATHLLTNSNVTPFGRFLRRTKLDELPQLLNVLKGEMSMVGPRPNLLNQIELINERELLGVYDVRPGITGLSQINGIDMANPKLLAKTDAQMISNMSPANYFKYIFLTITGMGQGDKVRH